MKILFRFAFVMGTALFLQVPVSAQFAITPGGLNNGIGAFQNGPITTTITGTGLGNAHFQSAGLFSVDHQFQSAWWFRGPGDTREFTFANGVSGTVTVAGTLVGNNTGNLDTGGYDFTVTNTAGYSFASNQRWTIYNPSATAGTNVQVVATNTITNTGNQTANFSLFFYQNFDVSNTTNNTAALIDPNYIRIESGTESIDWFGANANAWQVTESLFGVQSFLTDTSITNLNNTGLPFTGDFTGAFQWDITLDAGQSLTLMSGYTLNGAAVPEPGTFSVLALGLVGLAGVRRRR